MGPDARDARALAESLAGKLEALRFGRPLRKRVSTGLRCVSRCSGFVRPLVVVGVIGALLFSSLTGAQANTSEELAGEPTIAAGSSSGSLASEGECGNLDDCGHVGLMHGCALGIMRPRVLDGVVWAEARLDCDFTSDLLDLELRVYRNDVLVGYVGESSTNESNLSVNEAKLCSGGTWYAKATAAVIDAFGVYQYWDRESSRVTVTCAPPSSTTTTTRPCPNPPRCHAE